MITIKDVLEAIGTGTLDAHEEAISHAFRLRRQTKTATLAATILIGQKVKIGRISPKRYEGLTGSVKSLPRTGNSMRFDIELDSASAGLVMAHEKVIHGIPAACLIPQ